MRTTSILPLTAALALVGYGSLVAAVSWVWKSSPQPTETSAFTSAQRSEIVTVVRRALKTDPTILYDAIGAMSKERVRAEGAKADPEVPAHRAALEPASVDIVLGNVSAAVTVTEFYDPRCPFCRQVQPSMKELVSKDDDVRVVLKDIPILGHASELDAAAIAAASRQGAGLAMLDALMTDPATQDQSSLSAHASKIGIDPVRLVTDMKDPALVEHFKSDIDLARSLHVTGTPSFVIGDRVFVGLSEPGEIAAAIKAARNRH